MQSQHLVIRSQLLTSTRLSEFLTEKTAVRRLFGFRESFQRVTVVARRVKAALPRVLGELGSNEPMSYPRGGIAAHNIALHIDTAAAPRSWRAIPVIQVRQAEHSATVIWLHSLLAHDDGLAMPQHWDYFKPLFYRNQQHE
jgi:hypothetical protein